MNMYSLLENNPTPTKEEVEKYFDGNICRCTGFRPILDAFKSFATGMEAGGLEAGGLEGWRLETGSWMLEEGGRRKEEGGRRKEGTKQRQRETEGAGRIEKGTKESRTRDEEGNLILFRRGGARGAKEKMRGNLQ
jgi:xanthine dehydrogenase/oxidase